MNREGLNLRNTIFFTVSPVAALIALWYWLASGGFNWATVTLAIILAGLVEISITAGYHRLFSHRAYKAKSPVKLFFLIFGAAALQNSALLWSLDHRIHHMHCDDNEQDPYSIQKGFWWAHIIWLFFKRDDQVSKIKGQDLYDDKLVMWQHNNWFWVGFTVAFVTPMLIAMSWGDWFGGLFIAGLLRAVVNHHATFFINSLAHILGSQKYSIENSARDNWLTALATFGEGYHNFHHKFPSDYRNGIEAYHYDPSKWLIKSLSWIGQTYDLLKIPDDIISRAKENVCNQKEMLKFIDWGFSLKAA